jgi:hypothetical protein
VVKPDCSARIRNVVALSPNNRFNRLARMPPKYADDCRLHDTFHEYGHSALTNNILKTMDKVRDLRVASVKQKSLDGLVRS